MKPLLYISILKHFCILTATKVLGLATYISISFPLFYSFFHICCGGGGLCSSS